MSTQKVLGLDLTKTTLADAIAAMVEAWYEAQGVDNQPQLSPFISDPWWDRLTSYCPKMPAEFTTDEALIIFELVESRSAITKADQMRIAPMLREFGYVKQTKRVNGKKGHFWSWRTAA